MSAPPTTAADYSWGFDEAERQRLLAQTALHRAEASMPLLSPAAADVGSSARPVRGS